MAEQTITSFDDLLLTKLKALYDVEQQLVQALPKMAEAATDEGLKTAFQDHLKQTQGHVARLEQAFQALGKQPEPLEVDAIRGMVSDAEWVIQNVPKGEMLDAALIGAAQYVEHYEMAGYGTGAQWAEQLEEAGIKKILGQTLDEEKAADELLTKLAMEINEEADAVETTEEERGMATGKLQTGNI